MELKATDRHLSWILLVLSKSNVLEKTIKITKDGVILHCTTCLKKSILWKVFMKKITQILNFEIRTFYRYIDLYRAYFLYTLTFQKYYYRTLN